MSLLAWLREIHGLDPIPYKKGGDYSPSGFVVAYPKNYKRGEPGEWKHVYTTSDTHLRYARPVKVVVEQSDPFIVDASFFDYELGFSVVDNGKEYAAWGEFVLTEVKLIEKGFIDLTSNESGKETIGRSSIDCFDGVSFEEL
jgi:hypothetical protein